jgi:hypothetical protein
MLERLVPHSPLADLHARFLQILPRIDLHGRVYFRHLKCPHRQEDAIQEMIALAWKWFQRLAQKGEDGTCFPSALASFAARAVRCGRRLVGQENSKDVLSPLAQQRHHFAVGKLPDFSTRSDNPIAEALIDNTVWPVPEQVAFRLDFPAWLRSLSERNRTLALDMALGHRTQELARRYDISQARISQLRRYFEHDWTRFRGDIPKADPTAV